MVNARDIDIKVVLHERRDPVTGAIISSLDEIERSENSNLTTVAWVIQQNSINSLATLAADEVFVVTFLHFEPIVLQNGGGGGQAVLVEQGDGTPGGGHIVFKQGFHTNVPPFKRTLGVGRPIIIALGPGNVEVKEIGNGQVAGTITWYIKKTTPTQYTP